MGADMSASELAAVPVIDISGYSRGTADAKRRIARQIDEACRTIGFIVVSGHGVPDALVERMRRTLRAFFALPDAVKRRYGSPSADIHRGYYGVGSNNVSYTLDDRTALPDFREFFTNNRLTIDPDDPYYTSAQGRRIFAPNIWPEGIDGFRETWTDYYTAMETLATSLMRLFALGLDLEETWFDDKVDKHMTNLTVSHYPEQPEAPPAGQLRAGAHTDYGSLTILCTEDKPGGLEVQTAAGAWKKVPIIPGTFIINIGDLMARWTNDRWVSTMHRVVNPPRDKAIGSSRISLTFFHQPNYDAVVECLPSFAGAEAAKYPPITSGEHLLSKLGKMQAVAQS